MYLLPLILSNTFWCLFIFFFRCHSLDVSLSGVCASHLLEPITLLAPPHPSGRRPERQLLHSLALISPRPRLSLLYLPRPGWRWRGGRRGRRLSAPPSRATSCFDAVRPSSRPSSFYSPLLPPSACTKSRRSTWDVGSTTAQRTDRGRTEDRQRGRDLDIKLHPKWPHR